MKLLNLFIKILIPNDNYGNAHVHMPCPPARLQGLVTGTLYSFEKKLFFGNRLLLVSSKKKKKSPLPVSFSHI